MAKNNTKKQFLNSWHFFFFKFAKKDKKKKSRMNIFYITKMKAKEDKINTKQNLSHKTSTNYILYIHSFIILPIKSKYGQNKN